MKMKKIYRGFIKEDDYGENYKAMFVGDCGIRYQDCDIDPMPIAYIIQEDMEKYGHFLSVRYFITDKKRPLDELQERLLQKLHGVGEAEYQDCFSEITGYLWTDEELKVGGHDLMNELRNHVGKYCHLEIKYGKSGSGKYKDEKEEKTKT